MGKLAFVFSGQGAQYPGMGRDFYENVPESKAVFDKADAARPGTTEQCFSGTEEELSVTVNTQPCLFAVEMAAAAAMEACGIKADMAAGFSLGELSALTFAGAADFETMFALVMKRAAFMQEASGKNPASMAAVLKVPPEHLREICGRFEHVYPVNYNCPGNITVSFAADEKEAFKAAVKEAKGRFMPLKVGGGFHSPFMEGAAAAFAAELENITLEALRIPVYADRTGKAYPADEKEIKETLSMQICSPVLWEDAVKAMIADGADTFIEVGPGTTLSGMIRRISSDVHVFPVSDMEGLEKLKSQI